MWFVCEWIESIPYYGKIKKMLVNTIFSFYHNVVKIQDYLIKSCGLTPVFC